MIKSLLCAVMSALMLPMLLGSGHLCAQLNQKKITGLYTDFGGGWSSQEGAGLSSTVITRSHNLLAFNYNGTIYSTGANNAMLTAMGVTAASGNYKAMPIASLGGNVSGGAVYLLMPAADDGDANNFVTPYPAMGIKDVLTDGLNGLNIGTGVTNLPVNALLTYNINGINASALSDPRPVILCTQVAATGGGLDKIYFVNSSGAIVGDTIKVDWDGGLSPIIGKHSCDLYTLSNGPANTSTVNGASAKAQAKEIRMAGFKLSDFNISAGSLGSVMKLIVTPGGASDPAFVAYNSDLLTSTSIPNAALPVVFSNIQGVYRDGAAYVSWQTSLESNSDRFVVERSADGQLFYTIGAVKAAGSSNRTLNYSFTDRDPVNGKGYYRIKEYDLDGKFIVSKTVLVSENTASAGVSVQAFSSAGTIVVKHTAASERSYVQVVNMLGAVVASQKIISGSVETIVALKSFTAGVYQVVLTDGVSSVTKRLFLN